ncbi:piRNA biogenesis protein EXD1 [Glycine soja]
MASSSPSHSYLTHLPLHPSHQGESEKRVEDDESRVPIHIVTAASQLPVEFLEPSPQSKLVIGFDCEGVDLCRKGTLCVMQLAFPRAVYLVDAMRIFNVLAFPDAVYLVDAIEGGEELIIACKPALESNYITKVIHDCKRDSEALYFQFGIKLNNVVDTQPTCVCAFSSSPHLLAISPDWPVSSFAANPQPEFATVQLSQCVRAPLKLISSCTTPASPFISSSGPSFTLVCQDSWAGWRFSSLGYQHHQIAYSLIEEQEGRKRLRDDYISFVGLLADPRYCGSVVLCVVVSIECKSYDEKEEVRVLLRQDPKFWRHRPLSEQMVRAAADDVRFLLYIYHQMMEKLNERSLWYLAVRGVLYCRCFCLNSNNFADWPSLPPIPVDNLNADGSDPKEEILSVLDIPQGKMGLVIGKRGATILSIKQSCNAEILTGGPKGPPDKVRISASCTM